MNLAVALFLTLLLTVLVVSNITGQQNSNGELWSKQKFVVDMLKSIHFPLEHEEYLPHMESWIMDENKYLNYSAAAQLVGKELLPRGDIFTVYNLEHMQQAYLLYSLFYNSADWDTLYKNVIWARNNVSEGLFICAFTLAVWHRSDLQGIAVPAISEIYPYYFINSNNLREAIMRRMHQPPIGNRNMDSVTFDDDPLSYFTEDIGLNSYYYYFMMSNPFFLSKDINLYENHQADFYYNTYQQLIARYYLERQSNYLGAIETFTWSHQMGYFPRLSYWNGMPFFVRNKNYATPLQSLWQQNLLTGFVREARQIIDKGYFTCDNGTVVSLRDADALDYVGVSFRTNPIGVYANFYMEILMHQLLSGGDNRATQTPGALMHFETTLRDPAFYQMFQYFIPLLWGFKRHLPAYTHDELLFPDVEIRDMVVDPLVTYFEYNEADVSNVGPLESHWWKAATYKVPTKRINHQPFSYTINIRSEVATKGVVRMFLGPHDGDEKKSLLQAMKENFVLLDQYVLQLVAGQNNVTRSSRDFYRTVDDQIGFNDLYRKAMEAGDGTVFHSTSKSTSGWPNRLLLPKGRPEGFDVTMYIIITPYLESEPKIHVHDNAKTSYKIDHLPIGFPFDREINYSCFFVQNAFFKDVTIFHKTN